LHPDILARALPFLTVTSSSSIYKPHSYNKVNNEPTQEIENNNQKIGQWSKGIMKNANKIT